MAAGAALGDAFGSGVAEPEGDMPLGDDLGSLGIGHRLAGDGDDSGEQAIKLDEFAGSIGSYRVG